MAIWMGRHTVKNRIWVEVTAWVFFFSVALLPLTAFASEEGGQIEFIDPPVQSASPLELTVLFHQPLQGALRAELFDGAGKLRFRRVWRTVQTPGNPAHLDFAAGFDLGQETSAGRLVVTQLDEYGRLQAVNSFDLILAAHGETEFSETPALKQAISITSPLSGTVIEGGKLLVNGSVRADLLDGGNENAVVDPPLRVQLVTQTGAVISQRLAAVRRQLGDAPGLFTVELIYQASGETPVRLVVYQDGGSISAITHLASILLVVR